MERHADDDLSRLTNCKGVPGGDCCIMNSDRERKIGSCRVS